MKENFGIDNDCHLFWHLEFFSLHYDRCGLEVNEQSYKMLSLVRICLTFQNRSTIYSIVLYLQSSSFDFYTSIAK